jgi:cob(I)alamin adenosyltransferase
LEGKLPVLKNFILPGGTETASLLQYSRALSRRAERNAVSLYKNELSAKGRSSFGRKPQILTYLNRLSDYLFMQARNVNHKNSISEEVWVGGKH